MPRERQPDGAVGDGFPGFLLLEPDILQAIYEELEGHPHPFVQLIVLPLIARILKGLEGRKETT